MKYRLINYFDVWGNAKDGWEVNDQCVEEDDIYISNDSTPKEIAEFLKRIGFLITSDMRRLFIDATSEIIEVYEKKGMKPICGLYPKY